MCCSLNREVFRAATHYRTRAWQMLIRKIMFYCHCNILSFPAYRA